ncbi:hypothetical protein AB0E69_00130 [Kribbella sp. NPDC026611]|uniref:hypothetical protein n=1 Tax=Kribbella sp. NPDC026611 TaxID=3154911 RepID=UPI0033EFD585
MLRPLVATTAVTAAIVLLAGCGGDDKKSSSGTGDGGATSTASTTPSAPSIPNFDPPKAFSVAAAYPSMGHRTRSTLDKSQMGIAGQVALVGSWVSLNGYDVGTPTNRWVVPSKSADTTVVSGATKPMAVKVDGKDVALVAYAETDKGNGTQKPQGLVVIQWIDVMTGKKLAEISTPVSTVEGTGTDPVGTPNLNDTAYDPETGQIAVGVTTTGSASVKTVYADPKTQKATMVPGINPAAVHNGVIAGAKGQQADSATDGTIVLADGASGKVTKQVPLKQAYLKPLAGASKHAYFYGMRYTDYGAGTKAQAIFAVDLSTAAVVQTVPAIPQESDSSLDCFADEATSVVCTSATLTGGPQEILGLDDATGKKVWGFTSKSGARVVPRVTAAYHGVVYAKTEAQPVLLDAKTGQDLPSAAPSTSPSSSSSDSPSAGDTPSTGSTPSSGDSPTPGATPSDGESPGTSDLSLFNGRLESPSAVSPYGGIYRQEPNGDDYDTESVGIFLKPTA